MTGKRKRVRTGIRVDESLMETPSQVGRFYHWGRMVNAADPGKPSDAKMVDAAIRGGLAPRGRDCLCAIGSISNTLDRLHG